MSKIYFTLYLFILNLIVSFTAYCNNPSIKQGLVVSAQPLASQAGIEILQHGGNAVDAAVAAMFALSVVEPWASGLGGGGFMLVKMKNSPQPVIIDYRERAPIGALPHLFYRNDETFRYYAYTGYRSICVPGMVAGAEFALKQYGIMNVKQVLEPAIKLARDGFNVSARFNKMLINYYDLLEMNRATSLIFLPDWLPLRKGEFLKRTDLAITLEMLALKGLRDFYTGEIANGFIEDIERNNGLLTLTDLTSYNPLTRNPIVGTYRGYEIITIPPPSSGGAALIQLLHILEGFNLNLLKFNSGDYIHIFIEALKYVLNDREKYSVDPDFKNIEIDPFLSKNYCATIKAKIDTQHARLVKYNNASSKHESDNASHVSIIDNKGNIVTFTQSLNFYFGSGVTHPRYGILFNNGLFHFSQDSSNINAIAPKKKPASSMAPTIVLKNGFPFLILGTSGASRTISTLAHIIISIIDFNMDIEQAIDAPRFHFENGIVQLETRIDSEAIDRLKKMGHKVNLKTDYHPYFGVAQGILIDQKSEQLHGAVDPRGD